VTLEGGATGGPRGLDRLEERLEILERARLGSELIVFGAGQTPSEDLREIVTSIGLSIGVAQWSETPEKLAKSRKRFGYDWNFVYNGFWGR
jgi:hypothetical protein